jgi:hypothetical protein
MFKKFSDYIIKQSKWFWAAVLITVVIDALHSLYFEPVNIFFLNVLNSKNQQGIFYLLGIYLLFIIALVFIGMMSSYKNKPYLQARKKKLNSAVNILTFILISGFGIILMMPSFDILGMGSDNSLFAENTQYTYVLIFIGLFMALMVVSALDFKTRFVFGTVKYFYVYVPILLLVSLFTDFSTAILKYMMFDTDKIVDPNRTSRILDFIALFPLYFFFFSAPRFVLLRKSYNILPIISALASTIYFVWKLLETFEI